MDRQTWWSRVTNVGPVRHRAIDSSELRLTTDREGRQVGQHRSHIVAAVSSACLIARAAASGSRRVGSCQASRPAGRVQTSACLLSGVICRRSVRPIRLEVSHDWRVYLYVLLEISPNLPSTQPYSFGKSVLIETNREPGPVSALRRGARTTVPPGAPAPPQSST